MSEKKFDWQKGLRCGNCIRYFCNEYDGDQCENDNDMMIIKCTDFKSWRDKHGELQAALNVLSRRELMVEFKEELDKLKED